MNYYSIHDAKEAFMKQHDFLVFGEDLGRRRFKERISVTEYCGQAFERRK